jgi:hypothetical protein
VRSLNPKKKWRDKRNDTGKKQEIVEKAGERGRGVGDDKTEGVEKTPSKPSLIDYEVADRGSIRDQGDVLINGT